MKMDAYVKVNSRKISGGAAKTLEEARQIIQELGRLVIELAQRVEALEEA